MTVLSFDSHGAEPFALMLRRWDHNLKDATPAFEAMAAYQTNVVNLRQFNARGTVETGKWAPLSPRYGKWKAKVKPGRPLMVFSGDLKQTMTVKGKGIYIVRSNSMTVGTAIPYAKYHQKGTTHMPARKLIGQPRKADTREFGKILQRHIIGERVGV